MIEMRVRMVESSPKSGPPTAILEPRDGGFPRLVVSMGIGEAHALIHELQGQDTLPAQSFALLARTLLGLRGTVLAVELVPATTGMAAALVRLKCPTGELPIPIEVGRAIGLAVHLRVPIMASRGLLRRCRLGTPERAAERPAAVPPAFRQAFAD